MKVREGTRQVMAWLHGWSGLLLGWVLYVMALAGTLSVFKQEIGAWLRPEGTPATAPDAALANAVAWLQRHAAGATDWYLAAPTARQPFVEAGWFDGTAFVLRGLDAASGAPLARATIGGEFFYRLHFELQLPYPWGRLIAAVAAATMLLAIISGMIAHRRFFRDFFTFRAGPGQRAWLDGHNVLGIFALPFHFLITFTGLVTLATTIMPWGITANYGSDTPAMYRDFTPGAVERAPAKQAAALAPVAPMLAEAQRRFGGRAIGRVAVVNAGDRNAVVSVYQGDEGQLMTAPHTISFDGVTGRVLADYAERRGAVQSYGVVYGLHLARFAPMLLRWLYFVSGLMLTAVIATGLVLWIAKRREKAPLALGNRIVERLNIATVAGAPLAFAAYFWANRLLPLDRADRAAAEVATVFWVWGAAVVVAALAPPRLGWRLLLLAAGLAWLLAPLVGPLSGVAHPARLWPADLTMAAAGIGLLLIVRALLRRPSVTA